MKKLAAALFAATLAFSTVGPIAFDHHDTTVEAKSYKSGKHGFSTNGSSNNNSLFSNKSNTNSNSQVNKNSSFNTNKSLTNPVTKKGGFLKGMMLGGLAGMLFGGMLGHMGAMGNLFGFLVNIIAILVLLMLVMKIFQMFRGNKKREEDRNTWKR